MKFALEAAVLECSFVKHSQRILDYEYFITIIIIKYMTLTF
jgi:hypothetical protein